jgi:hypothetical protein
MAIIVTVMGILVTASGLLILIAPGRFQGWFSKLPSTGRFWLAIGIRAVMGGAFLMAAPTCRLPLVVEVVGIIALVAALALILAGRERFDALMDWLLGLPQTVFRSWSIAAVAFGALLIYAGA